MTTSINSGWRRFGAAETEVLETIGTDNYRDEDGAGSDLSREFEKTISEIAMGEEPSTVTHVLLRERHHGLSKAAIAAQIGKTSFQIEGTLALLEQRGWVVRFTQNEHEKYIVRGAIRN